MEDITTTKTGLAALIAVISYLSGRFNDLFWILCFLMIFDYISGYIAAWMLRTKNSRIGLIGIFKKLMYVMFVVFGFILDMSIVKILNQLHINFSYGDMGEISLGVVIMVFYIGNETISIVENFEKMSLKIPKWMSKIGSLLRDTPSIILKPLIKKGEEYIEELKEDDEKNKQIQKQINNQEISEDENNQS